MIEWAISLSVPEQWIYGIIFSGIVAVVVQWFSQRLNHTLAIRRERHKNIVAVSTTFRSAINLEIFKGIKGHQLHGALIQSFPIFKAAVHEYRINLCWFDRFRLNWAWKQYCGGNEEYPELFKPYCLKDNGPETLKHRLEKLKSIGNKR